jgi:hypothetical protein
MAASLTEATPSITSPSEGDQISCFHQDHLSEPKLSGRGRHHEVLAIHNELGFGLLAGLAERCRLRLAASFGYGLGEIREQYGEPEPQDDLKREPKICPAAGRQIADEENRAERGDDFNHEHDGVLDQCSRIELGESRADRWPHDLGICQCRDRHPLA